MSDTNISETRTEVWRTITAESSNFSSGATREEAVENHLRHNRDMKMAIADMAVHGPLNAKWANYEYPVIVGVSRTVTVTRTEVTVDEVVDSEGLPADAFGWERD